MSQVVKAAMLVTKDLPKTERMVALAIVAHSNRNGDAWPAVATIAEYVGCSKRTVQRAIVKLVEIGRLAIRRVAGIPTRVYRFIFDSEPDPERGQGATDPGEGVTDQGLGATKDRQGGDIPGVSPEGEGGLKIKRAGARGWRNRPPERRGAALPPDPKVGQCPRHRGSPAHNCGPCRSERLGGGA